MMQLQALAAVKQNSVGGNGTTGYGLNVAGENNIFSTGRRSSELEEKAPKILAREVSERSIGEEKERMTPAFNNRVKADSINNGSAQVSHKKVTVQMAPNQNQINAMNHTLNSQSVSLADAIVKE